MKEDIVIQLQELEDVMTEQLASLKPVSISPTEEAAEGEFLTFAGTDADAEAWKACLAAFLQTAKTFEIHCWKEETDWIEFAMRYGTEKKSDWQYGTIITGPVTPAFVEMLLTMPKPENTECFQKLTPFFNIFLDDAFQSSHYGTEVYRK